MGSGTLEVFLFDAFGLRDTELFGKLDPYVLVHYGNQQRKSTIARGQGRNPVWNQKFTFKAEYPRGEDHQHKLTFKIMDQDTFSKDDFVGESTIYVKDVLSLGVENGTAEIQPTKYSVVLHDQTYCGSIRVGVTFTRKLGEDNREEDVGGWKQSSIPF